MTWLNVGPVSFDADLVIFDKDGTLIDFEQVWVQPTVDGVDHLMAAVRGDDALRRDLYRSVGYDPRTSRADGTGPLATAPTAKLYTIAATVLYQHGFGWDEAEAHVKEAFEATMTAIPLRELVLPLTDVKALLSDLRGAGVRAAIVTTDDRSATQQTMALLGIGDLVNYLACGDDQIPLKPAPGAVLSTCAHLGVEPARTLVVGDTVTDMVMGERAGVGCRAAVLTGAGSLDSLAACADVVLSSIAEIHVS
jgi:phosphoglycolate phosphatase-like HAD superfamily hydrolase